MYWLDPKEIYFPPYSQISPEGIIALGGDLSPERLLYAYRKGIFPWYNKDEPIIWWCPDPRFVLFPEDLKVSKSMKKVLKSDNFHITFNQDFEQVILNCRNTPRPGQEGSWLHPEMIKSYQTLHEQGHAQSVEVWNDKKELVGGLYGVALNKVFSGESMFSKVSNASKAGFIHFVRECDFQIIDCQVYTKHLESLGAKNIPRSTFLNYFDYPTAEAHKK